ncbi:MAG: hypothetical protein RR482_11135, partial [Clostridia bacterium]
DGKVYGSLEYKNDEIGQGIRKQMQADIDTRSAFYIAVFDVESITRMDMDACADHVMQTVYLKEVADDFNATVHLADGRDLPHRYGCSGIDGTAFGPLFGASKDSKPYLFVAYGVYGDVTRTDNDYQVLLCYDVAKWAPYLRPLSQENMHTCGPAAPDQKLFAFTGNTCYGIQNLEYDAYTGNWLMAVYPGKKPLYPPHPLYILDGQKAPQIRPLLGCEGMEGMTLSLWAEGCYDPRSELYGWPFPYGQTGLCALGDGLYYISHDAKDEHGWSSTARLYRWDGKAPFILV